jgi:demethylmacrocin O-methyltransferase
MKFTIAKATPGNLNNLAVLYETDKAEGRHGYTARYSHHLRPRRRAVRSVLEIGVGGYGHPESGGESLRMWATFFPHAHVYGIDIEEKRLPAVHRVTVLQGDQGDRDYLRGLATQYGPFDLVVDDGSHLGRHQHASFEALFPTLPAGALYVIEDLETSYWPKWEGGPIGTPGTGVALVKSLVDSIHLGPQAVAAVHVYPELVVIEKAEAPRQGKPEL